MYYKDLAYLVKRAVAGRQSAGVGEPHPLLVGPAQVTPSEVQHRSLHHNIRNNAPINKRETRRDRISEGTVWGLFMIHNSNCIIERKGYSAASRGERGLISQHKRLHYIMPKLQFNN